MPISEIRPLHIKEVYSSDYVGLSQSYINSARQLYVALFNSIVENGLLRSNPARAKDAQPHHGTVGSHRSITEDERYWIDHYCADHRAHAAVMAMLYAGIRPQEMKALDIDRSVDFEEGVISLVDFAHKDGMYAYKITSTGKTDRARRDIPLLDPLRRALAGKHGPIITNADGSPINVQGWKCVWKSYVSQMEKAINGCEKRWYGKTKEHRAILAAGGQLPPWKEFTVVPYDLRHSFCTMCRDHGVELNTCIRWMGHADSKMILKIYDSVSDYRSRREAIKLNTALLASDPPPGDFSGSGSSQKAVSP
jgi:integrase